MIGRLTRSEEEWRPCSLLRKRFNLRPPHADSEERKRDAGPRDWVGQLGASQAPGFGLEFPEKETPASDSGEERAQIEGGPTTSAATSSAANDAAAATSLISATSSFFGQGATSSASAAPPIDEGEVTRPSIGLFKAIFEAEDEQPEEEEEDEQEEEKAKEMEREQRPKEEEIRRREEIEGGQAER